MFYVEDTMNLLLTVKEGSIVILVRGGGGNKSEKKNISIFVKLLIQLQCRVNPYVYREQKGEIPYCTYRFNWNIIVLTIISTNT